MRVPFIHHHPCYKLFGTTQIHVQLRSSKPSGVGSSLPPFTRKYGQTKNDQIHLDSCIAGNPSLNQVRPHCLPAIVPIVNSLFKSISLGSCVSYRDFCEASCVPGSIITVLLSNLFMREQGRCGEGKVSEVGPDWAAQGSEVPCSSVLHGRWSRPPDMWSTSSVITFASTGSMFIQK